eukprot:1190165-Prorocentrum_minimum.AAC.2
MSPGSISRATSAPKVCELSVARIFVRSVPVMSSYANRKPTVLNILDVPAPMATPRTPPVISSPEAPRERPASTILLSERSARVPVTSSGSLYAGRVMPPQSTPLPVTALLSVTSS